MKVQILWLLGGTQPSCLPCSSIASATVRPGFLTARGCRAPPSVDREGTNAVWMLLLIVAPPLPSVPWDQAPVAGSETRRRSVAGAHLLLGGVAA